MDFKLIYESLSAEEVFVEYRVRGIDHDQVGAEKKFHETLKGEFHNPNLKPTKSHITQNPETELHEINQKIIEIDEILEKLDDYSIRDKRKILIRIAHWRDRAERLIQSFEILPAMSLTLVNALKRVARNLNRDIKRSEAEAATNHDVDTRKLKASGSVHTNSDDLGKAAHSAQLKELERSLEDKFSKKLDQLSENLMKQLQTESRKQRKSDSHSCKSSRSSSDNCNPNHSSDSSTETSDSDLNLTGHSFSIPKRRDKRQPSTWYRRGTHPSKWKISYSGKTDPKSDENVYDFILKLEEHANQDRIPLQELVYLMRNFVTGKAEKFYYILTHKKRNLSWKELRAALLNRFSSLENERAMRRQIRHRTQNSKESFNDYVLDIECINARLQKPLKDYELLDVVLENMNPALRNATCNERFRSLEDLRKVCDNYEKLWSTSGFDPRRMIDSRGKRSVMFVEEVAKPTRSLQSTFNGPSTFCGTQVHTVSSDESDIEIDRSNLIKEVEALHPKMFVVCWNCKDLGHRFVNCPMSTTHTFCRRCGLAGFTVDACIRCQNKELGNVRPNVIKPGEARSEKSQNPTSQLSKVFPKTSPNQTQKKKVVSLYLNVLKEYKIIGVNVNYFVVLAIFAQ